EIPSLNFVHEISNVIACQSFGAHISVFHKYLIESEEFNYLLSISYWDKDIAKRDYDWSIDIEKNQWYSYENHSKFDLVTQRTILASFKIKEF
ncbi:MAG: hypothetical protein CR972_05380, partial [Candidatus Moraniibacteriota bacterium]